MQCPRCLRQIPADDVNLQNLVAMCRPCNEVFSFARGQAMPIKAGGLGSERLTPRPASIHVEEDTEPRRLWFAWFRPSIILLTFFCIAWDGFLVFWYTMAFKAPQIIWIMVLFPICHLAIGIGLTYSMLAGYLNRTVITLSSDLLNVWHGPVPWWGNCNLPCDQIEQLYCTTEYRGRNSTQYALNALLAEGGKVKLLSADDLDMALFCEQKLEEWLQIEPEPVAGEVTL